MEERILVLRAGIGPQPARSRKVVARILDLSTPGVRRLERRGLRRLRSITRAGRCSAPDPAGLPRGESTSTTLAAWSNVALASPFAAGGVNPSRAIGSGDFVLADLADTMPPASAEILAGGAAAEGAPASRDAGGGFPLAATFGIGLLSGVLVLGGAALLARRDRDQDGVVTPAGAVAAPPAPAERGEPRPAEPAGADMTSGGAFAFPPRARPESSTDRPAQPPRSPERAHLAAVPAPREPRRRSRPGRGAGLVGGGRFARRAEALQGGETCSIEWRPEYVQSRFRAVLEGAKGPRATIAESDVFPWPPTKPPEPTAAVQAAHESLVQRLAELGWEADDRAEPELWFAQRFSLAEQPVRQSR